MSSLVIVSVNMLAALLGCAWAHHRLEQTLDDLEYLTFAAQPLAPEAAAAESSHSACR